MALEPGPASLSSSCPQERKEGRETDANNPRLKLGRGGTVEPAPPGLSGAKMGKHYRGFRHATPFCFCSKSSLAVDSTGDEKRWDALPYEIQPLLPMTLGVLPGR